MPELAIIAVPLQNGIEIHERHVHVQLDHGPQTMFFGNYCSGIPRPANYEMPSEVREDNFCGLSWAAGLRYLVLGTQAEPPAVLHFRLLASGLRYLGFGT